MSVARRRVLAAALLAALLLVPLAGFRHLVGPLTAYLRGEFPPGQAAYIAMRPAAHLAFFLLWLQIILGTSGAPLARWLGLRSLVPLHRALGLSTLGLVLLHPVLFAWGRSLRAERIELLKTFFPPAGENYWETSLFLGALGLYALVIGVAAATIGPRIAGRAWRGLHAVNYATFGLAFIHAISVGSETRVTGPFPVAAAYWALAGTAALATLARAAALARGLLLGPATSPSGGRSAPAAAAEPVRGTAP